MRSTWWSPRAIGLHLTLLVLLPGFLWLGDWQLHRALTGNGLSWAYTVEWPLFAAYAVVLWWKLLHEDEHRPRRSKPRPQADVERETSELEAYNAYLASLRAADEQNEMKDA